MRNNLINKIYMCVMTATLIVVAVFCICFFDKYSSLSSIPNDADEYEKANIDDIRYNNPAYFAGLEIASDEQLDLIKSVYTENENLYDLNYNGMSVGCDKEDRLYYVSLCDTPSEIKGLINPENPYVKIFVQPSDYMNYPEIAPREGAMFNLVLVYGEEYSEARLTFSNMPIEIVTTENNTEVSIEESETITISEKANNKKQNKLYKVSDKDGTFIREEFALWLWNEISDEESRRDYELCEVIFDGEYKGLYIKSTRAIGIDCDLNNTPGEISIESASDYLLLCQVLYAYGNVYEHYHVNSKKGESYIVPTRIKYSLGTYSNSSQYLEYEVFNRQINAINMGIDDEETCALIDESTSEKYAEYRNSILSNENIKSVMNEFMGKVDNSGYIARNSSFDLFNEAKNELLDFVDYRLCALDEEYGLSEKEISKPELYDFEDIYVTLGNNAKSKIYMDDEGAVIFLPGFYKEKCVDLDFDEKVYSICVDDRLIAPGDEINVDDAEHTIIVEKMNAKEEKAIVSTSLSVMQSADLPAIFINTANGTTDYIGVPQEGKKRYEPGNYICYSANGDVDSDGELRKVRCRGNTTFKEGEKYSYQISFNDATAVLGMPKAYNWVLISNLIDKSKIRNYIMYSIAERLGVPYAVKCEYADVFMNGEYAGNYIVSEKPEVADNRIELNENDFFVVQTKDYRLRATDYAVNVKEKEYRFLYPKTPTDDERHGFRDKLSSVIDDISDGIAYEELIKKADVDSLTSMFLINMLANERDANKFSTYYVYKDNMFYAGPAWDYDRAFKNNGGGMEEQYYKNTYPDGLPEFCFDIKEYQQQVVEKWDKQLSAVVNDIIKTDGEIQELQQSIKASVYMDYRRYGEAYNTMDSEIIYYNEIDNLMSAIKERQSLINEILKCPQEYTKKVDAENEVSYWVKK